MPYTSAFLIKNDEPLILARIKDDGTIVNGGELGYPCIAIKDLTQKAMEAFGNTADKLIIAIPKSDPSDAIDSLKCPILGAMPKHPYTADDGYTYEKSLWDKWAIQCRKSPDGLTSPMTRAKVNKYLIKNELASQIIDDVSSQLKAQGVEVEVGLGNKTLEEIWAEFVQRQRERIQRIQDIVSLSTVVGRAAIVETSESNPIDAASLATTGGSTSSGATTLIADLPFGAAEDGTSASADASSIFT